MSAIFAGICLIGLVIALAPMALSSATRIEGDGYWVMLRLVVCVLALMACGVLLFLAIALFMQGALEVFA